MKKSDWYRKIKCLFLCKREKHLLYLKNKSIFALSGS